MGALSPLTLRFKFEDSLDAFGNCLLVIRVK